MRKDKGLSRKIKPKILIMEAMPLIEKERKILEEYADVKLARSLIEDNLLEEVGDVAIIMVVYAKISKRIINAAKN